MLKKDKKTIISYSHSHINMLKKHSLRFILFGPCGLDTTLKKAIIRSVLLLSYPY